MKTSLNAALKVFYVIIILMVTLKMNNTFVLLALMLMNMIEVK